MSEIYTFKAPSVEAAMELIRRDHGAEAVVLQSREVSTKRLVPWAKPKIEIEVTVGVGARWERAAVDFESQEGLDLGHLTLDDPFVGGFPLERPAPTGFVEPFNQGNHIDGKPLGKLIEPEVLPGGRRL